MLRSLIVSIIVLQAVPASAGDVRVVTRFKTLLNEAERNEWCGRSGHIRACTRIVGPTLETSCRQDNGHWRIKASASFTAFIGLMDRKYRQHELTHVRDIQEATARYIGDLESRTFETEAGCRAFPGPSAEAFASALAEFASDSNRVRG